MTSWADLRRSGIADAQAVLASLEDKSRILAAFASWWRGQEVPGDEGSRQLHLHPSTPQLAGELRACGLDTAADFAEGQSIAARPIHPGVWTFSKLLGESFVTEFIDKLSAGNWRSPWFNGLEKFGAWDAFESLLRSRLQADTIATAAAMEKLRLLVGRIKADPSQYIDNHAQRRGNFRGRVEQYAASPSIDDTWESPFDGHVLLDESFLWDVLLEVNPVEILALLGDMPHPAFMRTCLRGDRLAKHPDQLAELLKTAPTAFSDGGTFRIEGAIVILLLEITAAAVQQAAMDADGSIRVVPIDKPEILAPAIEQCQAATTVLLDALFTRPDANPLAWAWLDRLVSSGKLRGRWPAADRNRGGLAVNMPMLLIVALAERLSWRSDWEDWIGKRERFWRIHRVVTVFVVGTFGQETDNQRLAGALERTLLNADLEYAGIASAMTDNMDIVATVGGRAVCVLDDPGGWFEATWEKLRPIRELNWRIGEGGGKHNNTGGLLLVLWGFAAYELLPDAGRPRLWTILEKAVRDAWQTDSFGYAPVWTKAFLRLFSYFPPDKSDESLPVEQQLARTLLPYIAADYRFLTLATFLVERGWSVDVIRGAVELAGFDLKRLVQQFLDMKKLVFGLRQSNPDEIGRFRALAEALD